MNPELLSFIKALSIQDPKTLSQKGLKTTEEVGELAKSILPYDGAAGTRHRFVTKPQILENVADVMLCVMSIAYDLGYEDVDIESMLALKSKKWSGIIAKEGKTTFPLPFEIHISISDCTNVDIFKLDCKNVVGVKAIVIELEKKSEIVMQDVMTSSIHYGDNRSALEYMNHISHELFELGYNVVRKKIETVPWHPAAPSITDSENEIKEIGLYFESHLRIVTTEERRKVLELLAKEKGAHLSRNYFKKLSESEFIIMMTLREYKTYSESFQQRVKLLHDELERRGFIVDKVEIEYAIYDSNMDHDKIWF